MTNALLATEQAGQLDTILPIPTIETIVVDRIKITFIDTGDVGAVSICTLIKVHNLTQILFEVSVYLENFIKVGALIIVNIFAIPNLVGRRIV